VIANTPQPQPEAAPTLLHLYLNEYKRKRLRHAADATDTQYRINLRHFDKFLGRPATIADLTDDTVADLLAWQVQNGRSPYTANKLRNHILALWRFLARKRLVEEFPDVERLKEPEIVPEAWSARQLARLFKAAQSQPGDFAGVPAGRWWHALLLILWDTGERIGAVRQIEWSHVDLDDSWLIVPAENRKFGTRAKTFRLHPDTVAALRLIQRPTRQLVFSWPLNKTCLWERFTDILRMAGLPTDRRSKFHRIRRSTASHFEAAGGNATDLLGHSMRRVTERYLDPKIVKKQQAADVLFRPQPAEAQHETDALPLAPLLEEYAQEFEVEKWMRDRSARVMRLVRDAGLQLVSDLDGARLLAFIETLKASDSTKANYREHLRHFARWLVDAKGFFGTPATCAAVLSRLTNKAVPSRRVVKVKGGGA